MLTQDLAKSTNCVVTLLTHYSFDLNGYTPRELIKRWLNTYPANWIHLAVIEALYQGRYKAISIDQILAFWQRRGVAMYHFSHEFERLICGDNLPQKLKSKSNHKTNSSRAISKAVACFNNQSGGSEVVVKDTKAPERTSVHVDFNTKISPSTSKSKAQLPLNKSNQSNSNEQHSASQSAIKQFNPTKTDGSDIYFKLKAIVRSDRHPLAEDEAKESE